MKNIIILGLAVLGINVANAQFGHHHHGNRGWNNPQVRVNVNLGRPMYNPYRFGRPGIYIATPPIIINPRPYYGPSCSNNNYYQNNQYYNNPQQNQGHFYGMQQNYFQDLIVQIRNTSFESDKLSVAKQALRANGMTAYQIQAIMLEFAYESSRLDFAKFGYGFCVDPQNYYQVNSAFTYSSSIDDLARFLN
jgi:hypothetical protein